MTESEIAWRRAGRGLLLIGFGIFLLLTTFGRLTWAFWFELLWFWPVILVAVGLRLIFTRRKTPWAVLITPIVLISTMTYVAASGVGEMRYDWAPISAERAEGTERWTLEVDLALSRLELGSPPVPPGLLARGRVASGSKHALMVRHGEASSRVKIGNLPRQWPIVVLPSLRENWELDVTRDLPVDLSFDVAFVHGDLDLAEAPVKSVVFDGAFNDLELDLGAPETDTHIDFEGAFNHIVIVVPDGTPVSYSRDGFLNIVDGRSGRGRGGPGYRVRMDGAFNHISIRSR